MSDIQNKCVLNLKLSFLVDKVLILYIYASTVAIIPTFFGWGIRYLSYLIFAMAIIGSFINSTRYSYNIVKPAIFAVAYVLINMLVFFIYRSDVLAFLFNIRYLFFIFFVFLIPIIGGRYPLYRYLKHFFLGVLVQCIVTILLFVMAKVTDSEWMVFFLKNISFDFNVMMSSGFGESVRVVSRLNALLVPCFFYYFIFCKKTFFTLLASLIIILALYCTKSLGLYSAFFVGIGVYALSYFKIKKNYILFCVLAMFILLNLLTVYMPQMLVDYPAKHLSALIKADQLLSLKELPFFNLFLGYGHGYVLYDRVRNIHDLVIEVLPAYWIFVSGIFGLIVVFYLFLYPLFDYNRFFFMSLKERKYYRFIIASQVSIFFTCISNAYLLSGSTALFLVFFYCYFLYETTVCKRG